MIGENAFNNAILEAKKELLKPVTGHKTFTLSVKKRFDGWQLLDMYVTAFPHATKEYWETKIKLGNLTVNHKTVAPNYVLKAGEITQHTVESKPEPEIDFKIELVYETEDYWVINKPSPLPVHAGGRYQKNTLTHILKTAFPHQSIYLINRLDANTTGIVLVALSKEVAHFLGKQFEKRTVKKTYLAKVEGHPSSKSFKSARSIGRNKTSAGGRKLERGYESFTQFEVITQNDSETILKVNPHSGRTNQIRLHLADLNLPIVGDYGYKNPEYFENNPLTYPTDCMFLHAWKLKFTEPRTLRLHEVSIAPNAKWGIKDLASLTIS